MLRQNVTKMSQDCRRIWENLPAILTHRNIQCAVQVVFALVPRSKRKEKYHPKHCFKINSIFYKTINPSDEFSLAGNSKSVLICIEKGARNWICSWQAGQQL